MLDVKIADVTLKTPSGNRELLRNINFVVQPGRIYTILGKNGSGKSTLIQSLTRLLDARFYNVNASVLFYGNDLFTMNVNDLTRLRKENIKYVFQDASGSFDPLKKLGYFFNPFPAGIEEELKYFLLPKPDELKNLYPYEISGGMAQRLSFVLALCANPDLLIMDEPASGIDAGIANLYLRRIKSFVSENDKSVLLITQDILFAVKTSSYIAVLNNGSLSDFLPAEKFINSDLVNLISENFTGQNT